MHGRTERVFANDSSCAPPLSEIKEERLSLRRKTRGKNSGRSAAALDLFIKATGVYAKFDSVYSGGPEEF